MAQRKANYRPRRNNNYVPRCDFAADVVENGPYEVRFGPVIAAAATAILNAQSVAAAGNATLGGANPLVTDNTDPVQSGIPYGQEFPYGPGFGRNLQYVASGAYTGVVTTTGRDYLGQPMTEAVTMNGATPVIGKKAFKYIDKIAWVTTAAVTINVGVGSALGLPYRMQIVLAETLAGVNQALGTLITPDLTDPATTSTGEPRGTYQPTAAMNGANYITAVFMPNRTINASGNGGLFGIAHV